MRFIVCVYNKLLFFYFFRSLYIFISSPRDYKNVHYVLSFIPSSFHGFLFFFTTTYTRAPDKPVSTSFECLHVLDFETVFTFSDFFFRLLRRDEYYDILPIYYNRTSRDPQQCRPAAVHVYNRRRTYVV